MGTPDHYARVFEALAELHLFTGLQPPELRQLANFMEHSKFLAGQVVFREGEPGDGACFVVEGSVDVLKQDAHGADVRIAKLGRGRAIGEMALLDGALRSATVVAACDGALLRLRRGRFEELLERQPRLAALLLLRVARLMSQNLRQTSALVAELLPDAGS